MSFVKKYRKILAGTTLVAVAAGALFVGGNTNKEENKVVASTSASTELNGTMMQGFEWYLNADGNHWNTIAQRASDIGKAGFTAVWLPPAYKGSGASDVGYGVYDLYDLGEFNQKGTVRTKYGTKDQYLAAINALHDNGVQVYADIVLNHKGSADTTETVNAVPVQGGNRNYTSGNARDIDAWCVFNFEGRGNKYSSFKWNASCFDGVDYDNKTRQNSVFRFSNKNWDWQVDTENGNYDYLMYADVDFDNTYVVDELKNWGEWYVGFANLDGFRLDAVKHIKYDFFKDWLTTLRERTGKELFSVGEYWSYDINKLNNFIDVTGGTTSLFDVPLHMSFANASNGNGNYDMRNIANNTLVACNPSKAVTFVDNHDTQAGQSLQSPVQSWFRPLAYTYILTRQEGYPCVFYADYYGYAKGEAGQKEMIDKLLKARTKYAYGKQNDYIDHHNIIGWTREGDSAHKGSGLAALITDGDGGSKKMYVGTSHAGETWADITGNVGGTVTIGSDGYATFSVNGGSNSVWVPAADIEVETTKSSIPAGNNKLELYYNNNWADTYVHYCVEGGSWTNAPGVKMTDVTSDWAKVTIEMSGATSLTACFNDGSNNWDNNSNKNYTIANGVYTVSNGKITTGAPSALNQTTTKATTTQKATTQKATEPATEAPTEAPTVGNQLTVYYKSSWTNSYIHYQAGNGTWTDAPGVKMTNAGNGYAQATIDLGNATTATACFNNGSGQWDNNSNQNYKISAGTYTVADGKITAGAPAVESNQLTVYYYSSSWSNSYMHYAVGNGTWTAAPGVKMSTTSNSKYKVITIDMGTASTVTACFNNGSGTWDNNNNKNYTLSAGTYTVKSKKVTKGAPS